MSQIDAIDVQRLLATGKVSRVEYFETLGSTQDHATELARAGGGPLPLVVVAEEQTAGRGRGANRWWTGRGSLAFSLVFDPADWSLASHPLPERSLAVGVAIVDTLGPRLPGRRVGLHWPNDVFVDGRKIAGVLIDVLTDNHHVVGIGVNVNNALDSAPDEVRDRATSLRELTGKAFDRTELLVDLLGNLQNAIRASSASPEDFGRRFSEHCLQVGQELTVDVAGRQTTGVCLGVAPDGALLLDAPGGFQKFHSGVLLHSRGAKAEVRSDRKPTATD